MDGHGSAPGRSAESPVDRLLGKDNLVAWCIVPFDAAEGVGLYCASACQEEGLIVRAMGDSVAFCPPLIITEDQIDELISKFSKGLEKTLAWVNQNR